MLKQLADWWMKRKPATHLYTSGAAWLVALTKRISVYVCYMTKNPDEAALQKRYCDTWVHLIEGELLVHTTAKLKAEVHYRYTDAELGDVTAYRLLPRQRVRVPTGEWMMVEALAFPSTYIRLACRPQEVKDGE